MATYIKNDVQNAFTNLRNGAALAIASTHHGISRTTLRDYLNNAQFYRDAYNNKQRFLII